MSKAEAPTLAELMLEIGEHPEAPDGLNTLEWSEKWGFGQNKTRRIIKAAINMGLMTAHTVNRESVMRPGWICSSVVYRMVKK